jgi:hydroxysqualene dehydroxylase
MTSVAIIGAGWSGLAAAVELTRQNISVTVYESAKQLGGRARDVDTGTAIVDNGQHLMIGAYTQLLTLLKITGTAESDVIHRMPMQICMLDAKTRITVFELKLPNCPAPFNLLIGMLSCKSLSWSEKLKTLWLFNKILTFLSPSGLITLGYPPGTVIFY